MVVKGRMSTTIKYRKLLLYYITEYNFSNIICMHLFVINCPYEHNQFRPQSLVTTVDFLMRAYWFILESIEDNNSVKVFSGTWCQLEPNVVLNVLNECNDGYYLDFILG